MHRASECFESELVTRIRLHAAGQCDDEQLKRTILSTRFFAQAPAHPGFLASPTPSGPVISVFTSEARLARHAGAVRWFATTGADLVALAPVGHRFVIDPGWSHQIVVDPIVLAPDVGESSAAPSRHRGNRRETPDGTPGNAVVR